MKSITIRLDDETATRLQAIAPAVGGRSDVIRDLIRGVDVGIGGTWVVATRGMDGECIESVHPDELHALRAVTGLGHGRARFLRWGESLNAADEAAVGTETP